MRILYVENHGVFAASVISQFLSQHTVTVAPSLAEARRILTTGSFDVLLVDYDLDDGKAEVYAQITKQKNGRAEGGHRERFPEQRRR